VTKANGVAYDVSDGIILMPVTITMTYRNCGMGVMAGEAGNWGLGWAVSSCFLMHR